MECPVGRGSVSASEHQRPDSELDQNPALLQACGFDALPLQPKPKVHLVPKEDDTGRPVVVHEVPEAPRRAVPTDWNFSRFLASVIEREEALGLVSEMVVVLRERLMDALPDFGQHLGYDGKALKSHSTGRRNKDRGETSDPDADWGVHETTGTGTDGKPWSKIKRWFGYGLHLIADYSGPQIPDSSLSCPTRI